MKKIMAVGAMAAMLAGAAFAVDVSLEVQLDGSLAGYDGSAFSAVELDAWDATGSSDYIANLTVGGEKWCFSSYWKRSFFKYGHPECRPLVQAS